MKIVLIISSCIRPFTQQVSLTDIAVRENLHHWSLRKWIKEGSIQDIVVCDNSASAYPDEFVQLAEACGKNLEFLSFQADVEKTGMFGKGYGEGELMRYVMQNSRLMQSADYFFKTTGKLYIQNHAVYIPQFQNAVHQFPDFVFNHPVSLKWQPARLVYTDFYIASKAAFGKYLLDAYKDVRDLEGVYLEHVYFNMLNSAAQKSFHLIVKTMFPVPVKSGQMGSTGHAYGKSSFWYFRKNVLLKTPLVRPLMTSPPAKPRISIVTVCYNDERVLGDTIESVLNQSVVPFEYVLIDGGSTDGSVDIIRSFTEMAKAKCINYKWISEPDQGIADAFNKGVRLTSGDYVGMINAGDCYLTGAFDAMQKPMLQAADVCCGTLELTDEQGNYKFIRKSRPWLLWAGMYIMHPTTFVKRSIYDYYHFDTDLKIAMDYDFILFLRKAKKRFVVIKKPISSMKTGGASSDVQAMKKEEMKVMQRYLNKFELGVLHRILHVLSKIYGILQRNRF